MEPKKKTITGVSMGNSSCSPTYAKIQEIELHEPAIDLIICPMEKCPFLDKNQQIEGNILAWVFAGQNWKKLRVGGT